MHLTRKTKEIASEVDKHYPREPSTYEIRKQFNMKIGIFTYSLSRNLGDEVQSLAVAQHVEKDHIIYLDRDYLNSFNGWFSSMPENFPPSEKITPIFFGFHMTDEAAYHYKKHVGYFKRHEPIGCRDNGTAAILKSWGVDAYFSGCATMTFPRRKQALDADLIFAMDVKKKKFSKPVRSELTIGTQHAISTLLSPETKLSLTRELLKLYKERAKLVVTSRIHCAMPCAAMGIPVLYVGPKERRTAVIDFLEIPTFNATWFRKVGPKQLQVSPVDFETRKSAVLSDLKSRLASKGVATVDVGS
jgi:Polysaccharide pyruvyl transferase